jgi:hypothetical protein
MLRAIHMICLLTIALWGMPAYAQIYKWVDERGTTNYSSTPPSGDAAAKKPAAVADRISVYAPEPGVQRAIGANSANRERINSDRITALERQLAAERQNSQYAAIGDTSAAQAAYAQCLAERRIDCDYDYGYNPYAYAPYGIAVALPVSRHRPRHHTVTRPAASTGTVAHPRAGAKLPQSGSMRQ